MFTLIGILLILLSAVLFGWQKIKQVKDEEDNILREKTEKNPGIYYDKSLNNFPSPFIGGKAWYYLIAAIFMFALNGMFFWANAGTAYAVQFPWGGDKMVKTQGLKTKFWGRTIPISYEISLQDRVMTAEDAENGKRYVNADGIYNRNAKQWEFSDAIKARISTAIVIEIDVVDEEVFLSMADKNRSEAKLIYGRVLPNIDAALKNTCKLMDAQEYISGKASDFDRYFRDQLENGMYKVEEYTAYDDDNEIIGDTLTIRKIMPGKRSKQVKYRIMKDSQGNILRDGHSNTLKQYGISIAQAQVTAIDWEDSFDKRLDLQKNEVAKTQLEKQEAERQFYTAKKEIAKGEAEKASERARLEKEQIKLTIAAETEAKVAEQNVIVEKRRLEVEKFKAQSVKVAADAQYYANLKLVNAGLTPLDRVNAQIQMNADKWENIANMKLPETYISGSSSGKGSDLLTQLIGADLAKQMKAGK